MRRVEQVLVRSDQPGTNREKGGSTYRDWNPGTHALKHATNGHNIVTIATSLIDLQRRKCHNCQYLNFNQS